MHRPVEMTDLIQLSFAVRGKDYRSIVCTKAFTQYVCQVYVVMCEAIKIANEVMSHGTQI